MSWKSIATPVAVIIVGVILTIAALGAPGQRAGVSVRDQSVAAQVDTSDCEDYPNPDELPARCQALTDVPQTPNSAYPGDTRTPTPTTTATVARGTAVSLSPTAVPPTQ